MGKPHPGLAITLDRTPLVAALASVLKVTESRIVIPILGCVLITAAAGLVTLRSADLTCEASASLRAEIAGEGSLAVPAHQLHDILKSLPEGARIELAATDNGRMAIRTGRSRFHLPALAADEFPSLAVDPGEGYARFDFPGGALADAIKQVEGAISNEETRFFLNGIYLHAALTREGHQLRLVATDGARLSQVDLGEVEGVDEFMSGAIVGRKACALIRRMGEAAGDTPLGLTISRTLIRVEQGDIVLVSKLIDGTFPDYERVIPYANPHKASIPTQALAGACNRVALLSTAEKASEQSIIFEFAEGGLTASTTNADGGDAVDEIDIDHSGPPLRLRLNPKKLTAILAEIGADTVTLLLDQPSSPVLFQHGNAHAIHVLAPMRK